MKCRECLYIFTHIQFCFLAMFANKVLYTFLSVKLISQSILQRLHLHSQKKKIIYNVIFATKKFIATNFFAASIISLYTIFIVTSFPPTNTLQTQPLFPLKILSSPLVASSPVSLFFSPVRSSSSLAPVFSPIRRTSSSASTFCPAMSCPASLFSPINSSVPSFLCSVYVYNYIRKLKTMFFINIFIIYKYF